MTNAIQNRIDRAMTVAELIEALQDLDQDAKVLFACDYGDHCHTMQALSVKEVDELVVGDIEESGYSLSGIAVRSESDGYNEDNEEEFDAIVVLK